MIEKIYIYLGKTNSFWSHIICLAISFDTLIDEYSYILENLVTVFIMVHVGIYVCVMKHFVVVRKIVCIHQIEIICDKPALVLNDKV